MIFSVFIFIEVLWSHTQVTFCLTSLFSSRYYAKKPDILSSLKEYSSSTKIIENAKFFQKTAAPRPIVVFLIAEDALSFDEQHHLESDLNIRFSKYLE